MNHNQIEPYLYYDKLHSLSNNGNISKPKYFGRSKQPQITDQSAFTVQPTFTDPLITSATATAPATALVPAPATSSVPASEPVALKYQTAGQPQTVGQPGVIEKLLSTDTSVNNSCGLSELLKNIHLKLKMYIDKLTDFIKNNWEFVLLLLILILLVYLVKFIRILYFKTNLICWKSCTINENKNDSSDDDEKPVKKIVKKTNKSKSLKTKSNNQQITEKKINKNDFKNADDKKCVAYIRTDLLKGDNNKSDDNVVNIRKYLLI